LLILAMRQVPSGRVADPQVERSRDAGARRAPKLHLVELNATRC
jgi:hypothetical protein